MSTALERKSFSYLENAELLFRKLHALRALTSLNMPSFSVHAIYPQFLKLAFGNLLRKRLELRQSSSKNKYHS